jgi:hypothetical protein
VTLPSQASAIANARDGHEAHDARRKFLELYWGPLCLVESQDVESATAAFKNALDRWTDESTPPPPDLSRLSFALAGACRKSLGEAFGVELRELSPR